MVENNRLDMFRSPMPVAYQSVRKRTDGLCNTYANLPYIFGQCIVGAASWCCGVTGAGGGVECGILPLLPESNL